MNINFRMKEIVESKGLKQSYISQMTGMTSDCVSRILNGTRKITAEEFLTLCNVLHIDPNEFRKTTRTKKTLTASTAPADGAARNGT